MKIILKMMMLIRHVYTRIFEFFIMKNLKITKQEKYSFKQQLFNFQDAIKDVSDYSRNLMNLKQDYPWVSDPLRGLIDWTMSKKNLWVFFCHDSSRDCDDFSALAYHTLIDKTNYKIKEWCVFVNKKLKRSHMIVTAQKKGEAKWYIFDNHKTYTLSTMSIKEIFNDIYQCGKMYVRYR